MFPPDKPLVVSHKTHLGYFLCFVLDRVSNKPRFRFNTKPDRGIAQSRAATVGLEEDQSSCDLLPGNSHILLIHPKLWFGLALHVNYITMVYCRKIGASPNICNIRFIFEIHRCCILMASEKKAFIIISIVLSSTGVVSSV